MAAVSDRGDRPVYFFKYSIEFSGLGIGSSLMFGGFGARHVEHRVLRCRKHTDQIPRPYGILLPPLPTS
ncbi:MAG: hypothetical protein AAFW75_14310, partial [Cyanobacteria bacterium J06636_16]